MKTLTTVIVLSIGTWNCLIAQYATDYLPVLNSTWEIESISTVDDSVLSSAVRTDSLYSIDTAGNYDVYSISTSDDYTYKLETRHDTLFAQVVQVLRFFSDYLLELDLDPGDTLPIAIFSADIYDEWEAYTLKITIELPESIKAALPDNVNFDDEADIDLHILGARLPSETLSIPVGEISVAVFDSKIDLKATLYILFAGKRIPLPFDLLEDFYIRSYIGSGRGIVQRQNEEYKVVAKYESTLFNINEELVTLPAIHSEMTKFTEGDPALLTEDDHSLPDKFSLHQNYPNPFNPVTTIIYTLPEHSHVNLAVYNILGAHVITLIDKQQRAGVYHIKFDASHLPSGIYFYRLDTGTFVGQKRMVLVK